MLQEAQGDAVPGTTCQERGTKADRKKEEEAVC
jgi:hypothetical protein